MTVLRKSYLFNAFQISEEGKMIQTMPYANHYSRHISAVRLIVPDGDRVIPKNAALNLLPYNEFRLIFVDRARI